MATDDTDDEQGDAGTGPAGDDTDDTAADRETYVNAGRERERVNESRHRYGARERPGGQQPRRYGSGPTHDALPEAGRSESSGHGERRPQSIGGRPASGEGPPESTGGRPRPTDRDQRPATGRDQRPPSDPRQRGEGQRQPEDDRKSVGGQPKRTQPPQEPSSRADERRRDASSEGRPEPEGDENRPRDEPGDVPKYGGRRDRDWERERETSGRRPAGRERETGRPTGRERSLREYERRFDERLARQQDFQRDKSGNRYRRG